ncbi:MAG: fused MFS/spermidine synthase [Thermoanaerobaculia bacterium]
MVFGASTAASAAVLGIFMAGLGAGGLILGRRADKTGNPIGLYAKLELGISVAAGVSPLLLWMLRQAYVAMGGTGALGLTAGTGVRLLLSALVLGAPTFLMGGTLPALVRAVEGRADVSRRHTGRLYAVNTLGAVAGVLLTTFVALELTGLRQTLWMASLLNLLVAILARSLARAWQEQRDAAEPTTADRAPEDQALPEPTAAAIPAPDEPEIAGDAGERSNWFILPAAGLVGFAFLLMELVWYRMLAPILGGSSYTFGLILAVALFGIGTGSLLYSSGVLPRRPTLTSFATTCSLEAFFLILPFAFGDRIAVFALLQRDLAVSGFGALVVAWTLVTVFVVLPAAVVAGYQFPLLIAVLGSGRRHVGRQVGLVTAWNTGGAILGSIAGGFGLLPLLSAPGAWRATAVLLAACAAGALIADRTAAIRVRDGRRPRPRLGGAKIPVAVGLASLALCFADGPSAAWRHSPIGAGRMPASYAGPNDLRRALDEIRRNIEWEVDGVESSVAIQATNGYSFLINGKADGSARRDAPTQVMLGLLGAVLHPEPKRALVIGLGTGSSGGWLAAVPTIEQVDVVEIEPAIERVARQCAAVNRDAMSNPRLRIVPGDGREVLLTSRHRYDVIASEPSNPYRAGIASLYSRDFYAAVAGRLSEHGIFIQWLQGYEVDAQLVRTVYATLGAVFPYVESWQVGRGDLLLAATLEPIEHDLERIRTRVAEEPYRSALAVAWGIQGAEGFYSAFLATPAFAEAIGSGEGRWVNTDDHPILEFGFARNLGRPGLFDLSELHRLAQLRGQDRPAVPPDSLDWKRVRELRVARTIALESQLKSNITDDLPADDPELLHRVQARAAYLAEELTVCRDLWFSQTEEPLHPIDQIMVAEALAHSGDDRAPEYAERLRSWQAVSSEATLARWHYVKDRKEMAVRHLIAAFEAYRSDPWPIAALMLRTLIMANALGSEDPEFGRPLYDALAEPFSVKLFEESRKRIRVELAKATGFEELCVEAFEALEPWVPWEHRFLADRYECYRLNHHVRTPRALADLEKFIAIAPPRLDQNLEPPEPEVDRIFQPAIPE